MTGPNIRRGRPGDARAITNVFLTARARMSYLPRIRTSREIRAWITDVLPHMYEVWVAEVDGQVVGFAALTDEWLGHLYIEPGAQNRGVGTALLDVAKQARPDGLKLYVFQANTGARRFYERHGFALGTLTDGQRNEENEPDAVYSWTADKPATALT
jgi:GNAT superfamily N-acetyltransferase